MQGIFSMIFWVYFFFFSLAFVLGVFILYPISHFLTKGDRLNHFLGCVWGYWSLAANPFWKIQFIGREKIRRDQTYVLVSNHQSLFDIMILYGLFCHFKWLAKKSLTRVPIIGWGLHLNHYVLVKRGDQESRHQALDQCRKWLRNGVSILIFPEGTRSKTGELQEFHAGAFRLAIEEKVDIIPIVIQGSRDILPKTGFKIGGKSHVTIHILDPISAFSFPNDVEELKNKTHQIMSHFLNHGQKEEEKKRIVETVH